MRDTFLPFSTPTIEDAEINEVVDSLKSGWITTGPKVKRFEEAFGAYVGAPFAVPLSSATAGLHLTLLALNIQPGDEVITTPMTFASTLSIPILCGAKPVLVDIEPGTLNIDATKIRAKITPRTKAIIPVHFAGQACDLDPIFSLAKEFNLTVIEDAAHAAGSEYKGKRIGAFDSVSIFSFHPNKNLTTGEGGMVCTRDEALAEEISLLKFHGMSREAWKRFAASGTPNYDIVLPGFKYNMMDILITDAHYPTFAEMMAKTDWNKYGVGRDERCAQCMMHCGFEPTVVNEIGKSWKDIWEMIVWNLT